MKGVLFRKLVVLRIAASFDKIAYALRKNVVKSGNDLSTKKGSI